MKIRFAICLILWCATAACAATFYASPNGTGDGKALTSPGTVSAAIAACPTGGTVQLADGTYTGASGMIALTAKVNVVVRAANEGKVLIDGEGAREPIRVELCQGVVIEGIDACNSSGNVVSVQWS